MSPTERSAAQTGDERQPVRPECGCPADGPHKFSCRYAGSAAQDQEPTMRYAQIRGEEYVNVRDLARRLREQGFWQVAAWLDESANGRVTSEESIRVRR